MKKLLCTTAAILIMCVLSYNMAFAHNYTYFDVTNTNYPEDSIISDNITYVGGVYYMNQRDGGLFYSHDAKSWHAISDSYGAKIISNKQQYADSLIVFYNGYLAKSYNGSDFQLLHTFMPDTVIHYDNGLYTAYEKEDESGANIYFSFDAENWTKLNGQKVLNGRFAVDQYSDIYIINGITTSGGTICALLNFNLELRILPYDYVSYDGAKNIYAAIRSDDGAKSLYYSYSLDKEFTQLTLPSTTATLASYYNGSFYIATAYEDAFSDVYRCSDLMNWEFSDKFYMPLYKTVDTDGNLREVFLWHDSNVNTVGASVLKTDENKHTNHSSVVLANGLTLNMYGFVLGITSSDKPVNLLSVDGLNWHQANDASAYSILNAYSMRGNYMFIDRTDDHTILHPKGDPYDNIEQEGVEVRIDGHYIAFDQPPVIVNSRTMVPLRAIAESLGAILQYDNNTQTITIEKDGNTITMIPGENTARITYYDGAVYEPQLDSPAIIINGRTLVPVRFIGETFSKIVEWESDTKTVWITSK